MCANEVAKRDVNHITVLLGTGNDSDKEVLRLVLDPITKRLLVSNESSGSIASTPYIYNKTLTSANTEYSQALPDGTRKFRIFAMDTNKRYPHGDVLKVCFTSGGSGTTFFPIPAGSYWEQNDVSLTSKTLYFRSPTGSAKVIIMAFT